MKQLSSRLPVSLLLALAAPLSAQGAAQNAADAVTVPVPADHAVVGTTPYREGRLIVRFDGTAGLDEARAALPAARYSVEKPLFRGIDLYLVRILDATPVAAAIREVAPTAGVRYAVADHVMTRRNTTPDDVLYDQMWSKHNTGQTGGTSDADIDAPEAWDLGTGSSEFVVAVIDDGFDIAHVDLVDNIYVNEEELNGLPLVDDDGNGYVDDINGWNAYDSNGVISANAHGTHTIGIAGARGNNTQGVVGVNWEVTLMPIMGSSSLTSTVLEAYGYAADQKALWFSSAGAKGANVVATNSSFGIDGGNCNSPTYSPWNDAYDAMGALGILSAGATANNPVNVETAGDVPTTCTSDWLIGVTSTNHNDVRSSFAAWGAVSIDLGAPGSCVFSTLPGSAYGPLSGTSMAAPHVAGSVALMHSVGSADLAKLRGSDPAAAALAVKEMMLDTVDSKPSLASTTTSGGRLNLFGAAQAAADYDDGVTDYTHASPELACPTCRPLGGGTGGDLDPRGPARAGGRFELVVRAPVDGPGLLWVSSESAVRGPLRLAASGRLVRIPFDVEGGRARLSLALPAELAGETLYLQAAVAGAAGRTWTRAWSVTPRD